jgi:hypothetical protein
LSGRWCGAPKFPDRAQHLAAITEYDTKVFQVLVCQILEDREINSVLDKTIGVLGHAEFFEPVRNLLHRDQRPGSGPPKFSTITIPQFTPNRRGQSYWKIAIMI